MTIPIYPDIVRENNLAPDHGGSAVDDLCQQIHDATKGWGVRFSRFLLRMEERHLRAWGGVYWQHAFVRCNNTLFSARLLRTSNTTDATIASFALFMYLFIGQQAKSN